MTNYTFNGFLVQGATYPWVTDLRTQYRGVGCAQVWPLDDKDLLTRDPVAKHLTSKTEVYFPGFLGEQPALHIVPDLALAREYAAHCQLLGIPNRVLLCATDQPRPLLDGWAKIVSGSAFLGYDYAPTACDFSVLGDDLNGRPIVELADFRNRLNSVGLIGSDEELLEYIRSRKHLLARGAPIELDQDCCKFMVYESKPYETPWTIRA
jgi:hypothetical protein